MHFLTNTFGIVTELEKILRNSRIKMSDKDVCSNEEVINELTKDLQINSDFHNLNSVLGDAPDSSETETETDCETVVSDDFVDEEVIKHREMSLSPEELEMRKEEANNLKVRGNEEFKRKNYAESIKIYTKGLLLCPISCKNDRSILYCNRAAAKIQIGKKASAIDDCTKAIELNDKYVKAYIRRGKLYSETDKLDESLEDYKRVLEMDPGNKEARYACVRLPPLITMRNEKMKTEMLGKLKDLGNMFLKPFGLSTENFNLQQDPNTGGYSVNFEQKASK